MENISREDLLDRHWSEKKLLLAKTQSMKHSVPKGDKKRKKEVTSEIELLENELHLKHDNELKLFEETNSATSSDAGKIVDEASEVLDNLALIEEASVPESSESSNGTRTKASKAQRQRDKKLYKEKERLERIANEDVSDLKKSRIEEEDKFASILKARGLKFFEVPSDGDCMYKSIEHQLSLNGINSSVDELRTKTSECIKICKEEFWPFLVSEKTGDLMSDDEFEKYCDAIKNTKVWGGQIELQALVKVLKVNIEVIQAAGPPIVISSGNSQIKIILSYHRHAYHLGEHYNSLIK